MPEIRSFARDPLLLLYRLALAIRVLPALDADRAREPGRGRKRGREGARTELRACEAVA